MNPEKVRERIQNREKKPEVVCGFLPMGECSRVLDGEIASTDEVEDTTDLDYALHMIQKLSEWMTLMVSSGRVYRLEAERKEINTLLQEADVFLSQFEDVDETQKDIPQEPITLEEWERLNEVLYGA